MFNTPEHLSMLGARSFPTVITTPSVQDIWEKITYDDCMMHQLSIALHVS
jgi:hypothetical protein